ncbi:MAG: dihydroorotase, partial [Oscillospiraceae bacterium]|nr:dihydroorotase [Oscillospiraceae bacterium]
VRTGIISLEKLVKLLNENAKKRFGIGSEIKEGEKAELTAFDLNEEYTINPDVFQSMGKSSIFEGEKVFGKCRFTFCGGKFVYKN